MPGLPILCGETPPDLSIAIQEHRPTWLQQRPEDSAPPIYSSPFRTADGTSLLRVWTDGRGSTFRLVQPDGTEYLVDRSGTHIWMPGSPGDRFEFLLSFVLAFVLRLRGIVCLHASVVAVREQAIALAGPPGAGKSTFAVALGKRGSLVLTDDVAAVGRSEGHFYIDPGPARVSPRSLTSGVPGGWTVLDLPHGDVRHGSERTPLGSICFLEASTAPDLRIDPVSASDGMIRLIGETWAGRLQNRMQRAQEFEELSRLVLDVPLWRLSYDPAVQDLEPACELIEQTVHSTTELHFVP